MLGILWRRVSTLCVRRNLRKGGTRRRGLIPGKVLLMARRVLKVGEPIGATDPNEELIKYDESTVQFFSKMLARENEALDKIRSSIITNNEAITRLSNQVTR